MTARFDWTNIETIADAIFDTREPERVHIGEAGQSWNFKVGPEAGEGTIEYLSLRNGVNILILDCILREPRETIVNDGEGVRLNFALTLDVTMRPEGAVATHAAIQSWRVVNATSQTDILEHLAAGTRHCWMTIHTRPEWLASLTGHAVSDLPELLRPLPEFVNDQPINSAFSNPRQITSAVTDILACELQGDLRLSYIWARAQELSCLAVHMLLEPTPNVPKMTLLAKDRAAIEQVGQRLREEFRSPPSVEELARKAGLNRNKLYYGFRDVFGATISKYIQSLRLEQAHTLLTKTDIALIDLADAVGFSHQSNFSTAIRNRYGKTPKEIRREAGSGKETDGQMSR